MAAVLDAGPGGCLSHRSAAALWGLLRDPESLVEITTPAQKRARRGWRGYRRLLAADECTELNGIVVTTAARTLLDLGAVAPRHHLEGAIREAERRRLAGPLSLAALLARYPGRRGVARVRVALDRSHLGLGRTRSELEDRFAVFLEERELPAAATNFPIAVRSGVAEVDCAWRTAMLVVELDGLAFHSDPEAAVADRRRDRDLVAAGWHVMRVTWGDLRHNAELLAADLRRLLAERDRGRG